MAPRTKKQNAERTRAERAREATEARKVAEQKEMRRKAYCQRAARAAAKEAVLPVRSRTQSLMHLSVGIFTQALSCTLSRTRFICSPGPYVVACGRLQAALACFFKTA